MTARAVKGISTPTEKKVRTTVRLSPELHDSLRDHLNEQKKARAAVRTADSAAEVALWDYLEARGWDARDDDDDHQPRDKDERELVRQLLAAWRAALESGRTEDVRVLVRATSAVAQESLSKTKAASATRWIERISFGHFQSSLLLLGVQAAPWSAIWPLPLQNDGDRFSILVTLFSIKSGIQEEIMAKGKNLAVGCGVVLAMFLLLLAGIAYLDKQFEYTPERKASIVAARRSDARAKAAAEAAKPDDLELLEYDSVAEDHARYIVGRIRNNTKEKKSYVKVTFMLYNKAGDQVGTARDNMTDLAAGGTWAFKAYMAEDEAVRYKLSEIEGH